MHCERIGVGVHGDEGDSGAQHSRGRDWRRGFMGAVCEGCEREREEELGNSMVYMCRSEAFEGARRGFFMQGMLRFFLVRDGA